MPAPYLSAWSQRVSGGFPSWELRQATIQKLTASPLAASSKRFTSSPTGPASGDTAEWTGYPDTYVYPDGTFRAGPGVLSFDIRLLDATGVWGAWGTQTIEDPQTGVPDILTTVLDEVDYNVPFSQQLVATGTEPIAWDVSAGTLPTGLSLSSTGLLSGTATVSAQAFSFTARATNTDGNDTQAYSGTVGVAIIPPTITSITLHAMFLDLAFSQQLTATGDGPIAWSIYYPELPSGLSLSSSGLLSGIPLASGGYSFTVSAQNEGGQDLQEYEVTVFESPRITTPAVRSPINKGQAYSEQLYATGIPAPTFSLFDGTLPTGVSISPSGLLNGTPSAVGVFNYTVAATNDAGSEEEAYTQEVVAMAVNPEELTLGGAILYVTGGPTVNEGLYNYFGGAGTTLKDRERAWLEGLTAVRGSLEDMWHDYLYNVRGYAGSRNDMELRFWRDGGAAAPPSVVTKVYTAVWNQFAVSACGYRLSPLAGSLSPDNLFAGGTIAQLAVRDDDLVYIEPLGDVPFPGIALPNVWLTFGVGENDVIILEWDTIDRYVAISPGAYLQAQSNIGLPSRVRLSGDVP